ncbi:thiazole synthase [Psychrobacter sp. FDAARGOS_221]|uniref:thiazole synthase n=1 Tax=Psychrobacter sp. FDAARGOS_221 TaxID=1975705 RepID=UPI001D0D5FAF|nr:thiazole synthase [Psychrobacter sp. FDAARGOS_221]
MKTDLSENHTDTLASQLTQDTLTIGSRKFSSRLLVGTGKYKDLQQTGDAIAASGAEIVTVAIRRSNIGQHKDQPNLLEVIPPSKYTILPNTAGCFDADTAIRTCQLARELLDGHNLVKLEVLGDQNTLYPNVTQTLIAAQKLIDDGFEVMVYTSDDPIVAKELASMGCVAIMPLGSLIGSGLGLLNPHLLSIIVENTKEFNIPVLVDAGVGAASDAAIAMELGCDGVLMNSAIANAQHPVLMAEAMRHAVIAGRASYLAGRMPKRKMAVPSSPQTGYFFQ